ncbi:MAG: DUF86 domain-containing protein [Labilithrix sp.]|nr:DUF86 domain-containing protein [Labilithrix sp.]MCW5812108.1 DUF86 domain-containing protein [Labilithrix sp.]
MVDRKLVAAKLAELSDRSSRAKQHAKPTAAELASDRDALDLVSFNLMLAVQACADIASHVIADEGWTPAGSLAEGFARIAAHGVITEKTWRALARAVGLRNVVAHGYAGIDPALVHLAVTTGIADLDAFSAEVAAWMTAG